MAVLTDVVIAAPAKKPQGAKKPAPAPAPARQPNIVQLAFRLYLKNLQKRPLVTKALTSATISLLAELLSQRLLGRRGVDWRRAALLAAYGLVWSGPTNHFWQGKLEKIFPNQKDSLRPAKKTLLDQLTFGPVQNVLFLTYLSSVVDRAPAGVTLDRLRVAVPAAQVRGWKFWPAVQLLNQAFVPPQFRVLWINGFAFVWGLSMILANKPGAKKAVKA